MDRDSVYVGAIVSQNGLRDVGRVGYGVWAVRLDPILLDRVEWVGLGLADRNTTDGDPAEQARTIFIRACNEADNVAVVLVAIGDGPVLTNVHELYDGPAAAVVVDLWLHRRLRPSTGIPAFPGRYRLEEEVNALYPAPKPAPTVDNASPTN